MSWAYYGMAVLVAYLIGLSKGGLGGVLGAMATPLLALVMPADQVIGLLLPVLMVGDVFAVAFHWRRWDTRIVLLLIPGAIFGVIIATVFISQVSPSALRIGLGSLILVFAIYKLFEPKIMRSTRYRSRGWHGVLAGGVAGISSTVAHTGGPPVSVYLLMQNLNPRGFVASSALFFAVLNWLKVPSYLFAGILGWQTITKAAWFFPIVIVGVFCGRWLTTRINRPTFERVVILLLGITAILLLVE